MKEVDKKYQELARDALFKGLYGCELQDDISLNVENTEIVKAFDHSGGILRSNVDDDQLRLMAETVFETSIRLVRCLFFPIEARTIVLQGKQYTITAEQQLEVLRRNMEELRQYKS